MTSAAPAPAFATADHFPGFTRHRVPVAPGVALHTPSGVTPGAVTATATNLPAKPSTPTTANA